MPEPAHPALQRVREAAAQRGVSIDIVAFDGSTHTAQEAADAIGVELGQIVKSLVFVAPVDLARDDAGQEPVIALVRGTDRVDIAKLASVTGKARMRRASASEAAQASGYTIGGIPPFGHRSRITVVMDPALDAYPEVWAAAGTANAVFAIAPATLAMLSDALVAPCAEEQEPTPIRSVSEVQRVTIVYPGGLTARYRWGGSGSGDEVFALSEGSGSLADHGALAGSQPEGLCRAEMRVEGPLGAWTARFASPVFDEPSSLLWDSEAMLVVKYGFLAYGLASRTGELRWSHLSGTPMVTVLGSTRLPHVLVQSEVETCALDPAGRVLWRVAHSDVITAAELVGGRLTLTSYSGAVAALDPSSGRALLG